MAEQVEVLKNDPQADHPLIRPQKQPQRQMACDNQHKRHWSQGLKPIEKNSVDSRT